MEIFDTSIVNSKKFFNKTNYGNTITYAKSYGMLPYYKYLDLEMYSDENRFQPIAQIYTAVSNHQLYIIDFISIHENCGNGKQLLKNLVKCIKIIDPFYRINTINGFFSNVDFERWDKLIHIYSSVEPSLKFTLQCNCTIKNFLINMEKYKEEDIKFNIDLHENFP